MPTMKITVPGEKVREFMSLRIREIERQIKRGQTALVSLQGDLTRCAEEAKTQFEEAKIQFEQAQARMVAPPVGMSALGGFNQPGVHGIIGHHRPDYIGVGEMIGVRQVRSQIAKVENHIAELTYRASHVVWLSDQFAPDKAYELDSGDLGMLGVIPSMLSGIGGGAFAVGDPFDLSMLC